jgi:hypothetical protein
MVFAVPDKCKHGEDIGVHVPDRRVPDGSDEIDEGFEKAQMGNGYKRFLPIENRKHELRKSGHHVQRKAESAREAVTMLRGRSVASTRCSAFTVSLFSP